MSNVQHVYKYRDHEEIGGLFDDLKDYRKKCVRLGELLTRLKECVKANPPEDINVWKDYLDFAFTGITPAEAARFIRMYEHDQRA